MGIFGRKKQHPVDDAADVLDVPAEDAEPVRGPRDVADVPGREGRLDLGSIWLRGIPGMELRLEVDEPRQKVIAAQLVIGESQMQVQAFAAPRTLGIWDEIRDEIAQSLATSGGTAEEVEGPLGTELHARMPTKAANSRTVFAPVRFIGLDGPRWFFRGVLSGRAAIDEAAAEPFYLLLDHIVVVRGDVPMAPREVLPLAMPKQAKPADADTDDADQSEQGDVDHSEHGDADQNEHGDADRRSHGEADLSPFQRGPEITETR